MVLSIIIPVYNTPAEYLRECLASIAGCHLGVPYEIILVDDGSTEALVLDFLKKLDSLRYTVIHKENGGVSTARNLGLDVAKGEFILFLDADDLLLKGINDAIKLLQKDKTYDLVYCNTKVFGTHEDFWKNGNFSKFKMLYISNIVAITTLFRKSITADLRFNTALHYAEDWDFWCRIASKNHQFAYLEEPFFAHRRILDGKSLSQQNMGARSEILASIKKQFNPNVEVTQNEVNKYVLNNFKDNEKHLAKLFLMVFLSPIYKFTRSKGIFKNDFVID